MITSRRSNRAWVAAWRSRSISSLRLESFSMYVSERGQVRLGLVVVEVADEVLDGVLREELAELRVELGGERLVVGEDEGRAVDARAIVQASVARLARAGRAEQRLVVQAAAQPVDEPFDRLRLVAGRLEGCDELQIRHQHEWYRMTTESNRRSQSCRRSAQPRHRRHRMTCGCVVLGRMGHVRSRSRRRDSEGRQPGPWEDGRAVLMSVRRKVMDGPRVSRQPPPPAGHHRRRRGPGPRRRRCGLLPGQPGPAAGRPSPGTQKAAVVVAIRAIPARQAIVAEDVTVREVPLDDTNAAGVATDVQQVIGRIPAVSILQGQLVTTNMLASSSEGGQFSILGPDESVSPDSEAWRAVSLTVSDDLAVGGLLKAGQTVDVFVTAIVTVPTDLVESGKYMTDRSTKITYQNVLILAREGAFYIIRASLPVAEEISHLQAVGSATFSMALRPDTDLRPVDASGLGETTNRIIEKYGLPIPETVSRRLRAGRDAGADRVPVRRPRRRRRRRPARRSHRRRDRVMRPMRRMHADASIARSGDGRTRPDPARPAAPARRRGRPGPRLPRDDRHRERRPRRRPRSRLEPGVVPVRAAVQRLDQPGRLRRPARSGGLVRRRSRRPTSCSPACPSPCSEALGNEVTVSVTSQFGLITPLLSAFFGGQDLTPRLGGVGPDQGPPERRRRRLRVADAVAVADPDAHADSDGHADARTRWRPRRRRRRRSRRRRRRPVLPADRRLPVLAERPARRRRRTSSSRTSRRRRRSVR